MPQYDETFILDDNQNQRRNKRSYHVYKHGENPLSILEKGQVLHALEETGTSVIKRNIRNIKQRNRNKQINSSPDKYTAIHPTVKHSGLSIIDPNKYYDIRNNNNLPLTSCRSLDNLAHCNKFDGTAVKNGISLQNLAVEDRLKRYSSPLGKQSAVSRSKFDIRNSYCVKEAYRRSPQSQYTQGNTAPGVGTYRQINSEPSTLYNSATEGEPVGGVVSSAEGAYAHRSGSLRGANKLARRARSFKDDLLERISNMRSPGQHLTSPHLSNALRSHSPLSPKMRSMGTKLSTSDEEITPAKELERLVKEVTFGLKHFSDVIKKKKFEMLPDNGTIVFESIANIHRAIKPYCSQSPALVVGVQRLCTALAMLIRLCDEIAGAVVAAARGGSVAEADAERAADVVAAVKAAVEHVAGLAKPLLSRPALHPRPALVSTRHNTQRNSLPDISLPPLDRGGGGGGGGGELREGGGRSHSTESVLDPPPPKPARPDRKLDLAPPLPPKRKSANDNSLVALSLDRLSLQSHSSGSLDSMLNVSNDEDRLDNGIAINDNVFHTPPHGESTTICRCGGGRASLDSNTRDLTAIMNNHTNHNRFSSESGFVSVGHSEISAENSFTSAFSVQQYSAHADSSMEGDCSVESLCSRRSFENRMNFINTTHFSTNYSQSILGSVTSSEGETPPELPAKLRRPPRADIHHHFPNVEIRHTNACALHETRPHTMADHHPPRPPPLPLKKKHIMAYMEMFGNCSHPPNNAAAAPDMFRHSIHTYNLASSQHHISPGLSIQRQHVQRSIAQSYTVQHFGNTPLSGSADSVHTPVSGGSPVPSDLAVPSAPSAPSVPPVPSVSTVPPVPPLPPVSPAPPVPPALPPKMNRNRQMNSTSSNELLPPPSPRPSSHNSLPDEIFLNNSMSEDLKVSCSSPQKFPVNDEDILEELRTRLIPSPVPSQKSVNSSEPTEVSFDKTAVSGSNVDIILESDITAWVMLKPATTSTTSTKDTGPETTDVRRSEPEVRGGHPEALIVLATKPTKDFTYQEAFIATYRTWVSPKELTAKLMRRARHLRARSHDRSSTLGLFIRLVADFTVSDLDNELMQQIMDFIYWLVEEEELPIAKAMRQILVEKQKTILALQSESAWYGSPSSGALSLRRDTLLEFKPADIADQMTLLDAALFARISTAEMLSWPRDQSEEASPNLTLFTEHFNKMSYWARSRILELEEPREREKLASKFLKVMRALRNKNNFNSYLALVSALDAPAVRRLGWSRGVQDALKDHTALIDSAFSFRNYRKALAETQPPCIPYIGLVLQDLTFVYIGNSDLLPDGSINFTKRWQLYSIMENMKRFQKEQYKIKRNERIQAMFNEFDDVLSEEAMWQISETLKPRGQRNKTCAPPPAT